MVKSERMLEEMRQEGGQGGPEVGKSQEATECGE